jgi:hypothetical protein
LPNSEDLPQKKSLSCLCLRRPKHLHILPLPELEKLQPKKQGKKKKKSTGDWWVGNIHRAFLEKENRQIFC